jgi:hypothetical protein
MIVITGSRRSARMPRIKTIEENVALPLALGPSAERDIPLPMGVVFHIVHSKLWHLIGWSDEASNSCGLWHKGMAIMLARDRLIDLSIDLMHPAKGKGWVALDARLSGQAARVTLLQSVVFDPKALLWLQQHEAKLVDVFGHAIVTNDRGCDY